MGKRALWIVGSLSLLLALQVAAAYALSLNEQPPASPSLESLPHEIGRWKLAGEQLMEPEVAAYLRPDDYIDRNYLAQGPAGRVNLFVAYFKSLKSGYGPHSPGICLPGAGWKPKQVDVVRAQVGSETIPVNQYILEKDRENLLVLYWYQNERRIWAEEFRAKIFMLPDLLRYRRSDVALVRIITPLDSNAMEPTRADLLSFVQSVFPHLTKQFSSL